MAYPMHRLLELSTPSAHVAVPGPVEPAIVSYYLELIGIGAGDRLVITVDGAPTEPAPRSSPSTTCGRRGFRSPTRTPTRPPRSASGSATTAPSRCCPRTTAYPATGHAPVLRLVVHRRALPLRRPHRRPARGARRDRVVRDRLRPRRDGHAAAIGASAQPEEHAHATLLALRANAFRAGTISGVAADWREASPRCARPGPRGTRSRAPASSCTASRRSRRRAS